MPRGRRPLTPGTYRTIRTYYWHNGKWTRCDTKPPDSTKPTKWKAVTQYRPLTGPGDTVQREKQGTSRTKARDALEAELVAEGGSRNQAGVKTRLTGQSRVADAARLYLAALTGDQVTIEIRTSQVDNFVIPQLGALRLDECTTARLNEFMATLTRPRPGKPRGYAPHYRRSIRVALAGVLQVAVDEQVLPTNPAKNLNKISGGTLKQPMAYDGQQVARFLELVDADTTRPSRRYRIDLPALCRLMFGTGLRLGEALGLRWRDINLGGKPVRAAITLPDGTYIEKLIPPHSAWINGNAVRRTRRGVVRNPGKTPAARRMVGLPEDLVLLFTTMRPAGDVDDRPVFGRHVDLYYDPKAIGCILKDLRHRIDGYDNLISHLCRKTAVTALHNAGQSDRQIADQMGWSSTATIQPYLGHGVNTEAANILGSFSRPTADRAN